MKAKMGLLVILAICSVQIAGASSRVISASTDSNGNQHNSSAAIGGPATLTCISGGGQNVSCFVTAPGVAQQLYPPKGQAGTSGAGTVNLSCNGNGALRCSLRIDGPVAADEKKPDDKK